MTDLEIIKRCAVKEGRTVRPFTAKSAVCYDVSDSAIVASNSRGGDDIYDPTTNDAQCFALMKKLKLIIGYEIERDAWVAMHNPTDSGVRDADANRAICVCVANLK